MSIAQSIAQSYIKQETRPTSDRPINQPVALREVWAKEDQRSLFLDVHIPFCEMRCGFCNLFATLNRIASYLGNMCGR